MIGKSPSNNIACLLQALAAWKDFAPATSFGGKQVSDLEAAVTVCQTDRSNLVNAEMEVKSIIVTRDNNDEAALMIRQFLVNGVIGDPNFGPNSAFYEALGYIRKDDRKSGLTRRRGEPVTA